MNSFIDTNVIIAYVLLINSSNNKAKLVFEEYDTIFISNNVKIEFDKVFRRNTRLFTKFFKDFANELSSKPNIELNFRTLEKYLSTANFSKDEKEKIRSTFKNFWQTYVKESFPSTERLFYGINQCLLDLKNLAYSKKTKFEEKIRFTEERLNEYKNIRKKLERFHVHESDIKIILDAHDHNLKTKQKLDFITFDKKFYRESVKIKEFCFNKIKGKDDFFTPLNI